MLVTLHVKGTDFSSNRNLSSKHNVAIRLNADAPTRARQPLAEQLFVTSIVVPAR